MKGALREAKILKLWASGKSGGQVAEQLGITRNIVIGVVGRAGKRIEKATGKNPYARPNQSLNVQNGLGRQPKKFKAPKPEKIAKPKPVPRQVDVSDLTPGDRLPPLVKLDDRLWISLPGTEPKPLLELSSTGCKWPVDGSCITLFCAADQEDDSSYCKTHKSWSLSKKPLAPLNFGKAA